MMLEMAKPPIAHHEMMLEMGHSGRWHHFVTHNAQAKPPIAPHK